MTMEGNKLKAEVAEKIMGIKVEYPDAEGYPFYLREDENKEMKWDIVPDYPGDISAAWQVVEKMRSDEVLLYRFGLALSEMSIDPRPITKADYIADLMRWLCAEAICKAALLAIEGGEK